MGGPPPDYRWQRLLVKVGAKQLVYLVLTLNVPWFTFSSLIQEESIRQTDIQESFVAQGLPDGFNLQPLASESIFLVLRKYCLFSSSGGGVINLSNNKGWSIFLQTIHRIQLCKLCTKKSLGVSLKNENLKQGLKMFFFLKKKKTLSVINVCM